MPNTKKEKRMPDHNKLIHKHMLERDGEKTQGIVERYDPNGKYGLMDHYNDFDKAFNKATLAVQVKKTDEYLAFAKQFEKLKKIRPQRRYRNTIIEEVAHRLITPLVASFGYPGLKVASDISAVIAVHKN